MAKTNDIRLPVERKQQGFTWIVLLLVVLVMSGCFKESSKNTQKSERYWIEDKSAELTFEDILNRDLTSEWSEAPEKVLNFGFTESVIWLSLPFENTKDVQTPMLLEVAFPLHDRIDVYLLDGNKVVSKFHSGDQLAFSERPMNHRNFLFPHTVPAKTKLRAIVRIQTTDSMCLPVNVWESSEFFEKDQHEILFLGLFFGLISIMLVYNFLLYNLTRQKSYLYYCWCTASILYLQLTQKNLGYQYFWSENVFFNHMSAPVASLMAIATSSFFILKFLDLDEKQYKKTVLAFNSMTYLALMGIIWVVVILYAQIAFVPYIAMILATAVIGGIATIVVMGVLINLSIKGNRSAQILSIAWLSLLAGSLVFVLGRIGVPLPLVISENAMLLGSSLEVALISFALARHIKSEREARIFAQDQALENERKSREAQNSLLKLREKNTRQLENEVKERTWKLEKAMQSLTLANHKLDNLSRMDSLTGLSNRRNFDQAFNEEWLICTDLQQPMSLLMADIDHFKAVNDTYGHLFGDQCLVKTADILKRCVNQPKHLAARFGGEEFIIMLPNTDAKAAGLVAESIRREVEKLRLNYQGEQVRFTISIGTSTIIPSPDASFVDLNERADQALYLAKEGGRNRIVIADGESFNSELIALRESLSDPASVVST